MLRKSAIAQLHTGDGDAHSGGHKGGIKTRADAKKVLVSKKVMTVYGT